VQPLLAGGVGLLSLIAGGIVLTVSLIFIVTLCTNPLIALAAITAMIALTTLRAGPVGEVTHDGSLEL